MGDTYLRVIPNDDLSYKRPQHVYESVTPCPMLGIHDDKVICQLTTNTNEATLWCPADCHEANEWTMLRKCFQAMGTNFATVWHDTDQINLSTGRVETDPRKFRQHLREQSDIASERLGMTVDYQPVDMTDRDALGVTDEGLDATHDTQVARGEKDSRGRFVW